MTKVKRLAVNTLSKISVLGGVTGAFMFGAAVPAFAADDEESFLPLYIQQILDKVMGTGGPSAYINNQVRTGLTVLFVLVFIVAIVYSALAAIKFISSQGDASKLEESKGAIKAILMGFAAMLVAIIGLFVILWVLGASDTPEEQINIPQA